MNDIPLHELCPACEREGRTQRGHYDGRVLINGRGLWICDHDPSHKWQNADETPSFSEKDARLG